MHAAVRLAPTGVILVGRLGENHAMLWEIAAKKGLVGTNPAGQPWLDKIEDGFVTASGRFVDREEALKTALSAGQIVESDCGYIEAQNGGPGLELLTFEERRRPAIRRTRQRKRCHI